MNIFIYLLKTLLTLYFDLFLTLNNFVKFTSNSFPLFFKLIILLFIEVIDSSILLILFTMCVQNLLNSVYLLFSKDIGEIGDCGDSGRDDKLDILAFSCIYLLRTYKIT